MHRQLSLVSFYGDKPRTLGGLIDAAQGTLKASVPAFRPYAVTQVHATLVGLETSGTPTSGRCNINFLRHRGATCAMDISGYVASLQHSACLPMTIQVGGFEPGAAPFLSRGRPPYDRTFSIQGGMAVVMGWPVRPGERTHDGQRSGVAYPASLDRLRRAAQAFGILHAWHRRPDDVDNDFYLRLGLFDTTPSQADIDAAGAALRPLFAQRHVLECTRDDLYVVSYFDETLPPSTTRACRITDPEIADFVASSMSEKP